MGIGNTISPDAQSADAPEGDDAALDGPDGPPKRSRLRTAWQTALDMILPPLCLGCQTRLVTHDALCPACWRQIDFIRAPLCDRLGLPLPFDTGGVMISAAAAANPPDYDRARAVARFDGLMRDLVHDLKFNDTHDARRLFGRWLSEAGRDVIADCEVIVPIPLARWRLLTRRFNQAQLLAREVGRHTGLPVAPLALIRTRSTASQVGLSRAERARNVAGAFTVTARAKPLIAGKSVLLIDDVITTGATLSAAARALKKAGAARVDVLALGLVSHGGT